MVRKKKKDTSSLFVILIGIVIMVTIAVVMLMHTGNDKKQETADVKDTSDIIPYGDSDADSYDYEGDYFDTATEKGTMTIKKNLTAYDINITYAESDDAMTIWTMTASYDKSRRALAYKECTKTDYIFSATDDGEGIDASGDVFTDEGYTDGTGYIYLTNGNIFWIDDKEEMGAGLIFSSTDSDSRISEDIMDKVKKASAKAGEDNTSD